MWQSHSAEGKPAVSVPTGACLWPGSKAGGSFRDQDSDQPTEKAGCKSQGHWDRGQGSLSRRAAREEFSITAQRRALGGGGTVVMIMMGGGVRSSLCES